MPARRLAATVAVAAVALAAAASGGATSTAYTDAIGDAGSAPDVYRIIASNDAQARLTFRIGFSNRQQGWVAGDEIEIAVDADGKRSTGAPARGTDILIKGRNEPGASPKSTSWGIFRWNGSSFLNQEALTSAFVGAMNGDPALGMSREIDGILTLALPRSLLGIDGSFSFSIATKAAAGGQDLAPEANAPSFSYIVDLGAPVVRARKSSGRRGTPVRLRYTVSDDSGRSQEAIVVTRRSKTIATLRGRMGEAKAGRLYFLLWRPARKLVKGPYRFCVASVDRVGNVSKPSCATVQLK